jgi:protein-S-isoprenylcysteine O-methyltransferase Ste14
VTTGPYRVVRHPGYLSSICLWVGAGLSFENFVLIGLYGLKSSPLARIDPFMLIRHDPGDAQLMSRQIQ